MSRLLVAVRGDLTQTEAGHLAGLTQPKVSRAESGRFPLSPAEAEAYARACSAAPAQRRRLVELATAFTQANITTRAALVRSARTIQERVGRLEIESKLIRSWQPDIVLGTLQTPGYTAAVIGTDPGPEWLAARSQRRALLAEPGRTWHQLMSEGALRWLLGSRAEMVTQMQHLIEVSHSPNIRLGIIDQATVKPTAPPAAFHLYGHRTASVATETATAFLTDPHDIEHYETRFAELDALALYDDDARALLARLADEYRTS